MQFPHWLSRLRSSEAERLSGNEEALGAIPSVGLSSQAGAAKCGPSLIRTAKKVQLLPPVLEANVLNCLARCPSQLAAAGTLPNHGSSTGQARQRRFESDWSLKHGLGCKSSAIRPTGCSSA